MMVRNSHLGRFLDHARFGSPACSIVLLDSGYLTVAECGRALRRLGHRVYAIAPGDDFIRRLLTLLVEVKPDFLLTVNHLGFDEEGKLTGLLSELRLPFASWYVDSPAYVLKDRTENVSSYCAVFTWDDTCRPRLERMGFSAPVHLPLATDPELFRPRGTASGPQTAVPCFVGNSLRDSTSAWAARVAPARLARLKEKAVGRQLEDRRTAMADILGELGESGAGVEGVDLEAALVWEATRRYRSRVMTALLPLGLVVHGDAGWRDLLGEEADIREPVDYYRELPGVFAAAAVNVNATSLQMNATVNQRVFDVAACGAFLLTDRTPDMERFFEPGVEAVCYETPEEARDLAAFYLGRETERQRIAGAARTRVLAEHTYEKRMTVLVERMRERFA